MLRTALALTMPAMLFCVAMTKQLVPLMLGARWTLAAPIFSWVCFGGLIAPLFSSTGWIFTTQNRAGEQMRTSVATAAINVVSLQLACTGERLASHAYRLFTFTFIQVPLILYVMTRKGFITLPDILRTLKPFLIATLLVSLPLYRMRFAGRSQR